MLEACVKVEGKSTWEILDGKSDGKNLLQDLGIDGRLLQKFVWK
jgi:hypothetical protein